MNRITKIISVLFISLFIFIPSIMAEGEEKQPVDVYVFRGEGCSHCAEFFEWINGLDDTTKAKFNLIDYEVWNSSENQDLMHRVADVFSDSDVGVPYVIIGDKTFIGFSDVYKTQMLNKINELLEVNKEDRYDVMQHLGEKKEKNVEKESAGVMIVIIFAVIVLGGVLIYMVSKS